MCAHGQCRLYYIVKLQSQVQTSVLGLVFGFVLPLSQQEKQEQEQQERQEQEKKEPAKNLEFDTKDQVLFH